MNTLSGETEISLDGKLYILRFPWTSLAAVIEQYGEDPNLFDVKTLASVTAEGLRARYPEMTAERILKISPPLIPTGMAVQAALNAAFFGPNGPPTEGAEVKKKSPLLTLFWRRITRPWRQG